MKHTHSRIWVHLVWTTKFRERILFKETGKILFDFLINKAKETGIPFEALNIQPEHIHGLIDLPTDKTIADFIKAIKGSSSHMLNNEVFKTKFAWQRGYGAYSVSASQFDVVKNYIVNQTEHHKSSSFADEYEKWKNEYGLFDD